MAKKITMNSFPQNDNEIALGKITAEYIQDLDCCQTEDSAGDCCQTLIVSTDDGGGGKFIRFNTGSAGWSVDNPEEILDILKDFQNRFCCEE